jgi:thermostable 8-oxoguanine DNA glycosylase
MDFDHDLITSKAEEYWELAPDSPRYQEEEEPKLDELPTKFENHNWDWDDLIWIYRWKSPRSIGDFKQNDPERVDKVFSKVVDTSSTRRKLALLKEEVNGLRVPTGSAFLLFMNPEKYTVMDSNAGEFLQQQGYLPTYSDDPSYEEYINYLDVCRGIADDCDVELRTLDRALWVLGKQLE